MDVRTYVPDTNDFTVGLLDGKIVSRSLIMKLNTRYKKPKVYNILILTAVAAIVIFAFKYFGNGGSVREIALTVDLYFALVLIFLVAAFIKQLQYNPYSYNSIYYTGFALLVCFVLIVDILVTVRIFKNPAAYSETELLNWMSSVSRLYVLITFPLVLVFSCMLIVSNIVLLRRERKRLANVLGIVFAILLIGGAGMVFLTDLISTRNSQQPIINLLLMNLFSSIYLYFECMLSGAVIASLIVADYEPEYDMDFLIVLGCGLRKDGTPTPLLRGRLDRAIEFCRRQKAKTGKDLIFVTSGGQGPDEVISESASMKNYLISQGIPESQIIEEDKSSSTLENMRNSKEKIFAVNPDGKIAFSTTKYHVFRSGLCGRRVKMRVLGFGSGTKWYFWPNAWVREFVGLVTEHRGKQILILLGLIAVNVLLMLTAK